MIVMYSSDVRVNAKISTLLVESNESTTNWFNNDIVTHSFAEFYQYISVWQKSHFLNDLLYIFPDTTMISPHSSNDENEYGVLSTQTTLSAEAGIWSNIYNYIWKKFTNIIWKKSTSDRIIEKIPFLNSGVLVWISDEDEDETMDQDESAKCATTMPVKEEILADDEDADQIDQDANKENEPLN